MLFDLGWSEILLIGIVALIFIGPKDLPKALRVAGYWVRKARTLSREFQSSIDQMIREAELDEMRQQLNKAAELDLEQEFRNTVDPTGSLAQALQPPELPDFSQTAPAPPIAAENPPAEPLPASPAPAAAVELETVAAHEVPVVAPPETEPDEPPPPAPSAPAPTRADFVPPKP